MKRNDYYYRVGIVSFEYPSRKEIFVELAGWWSWREVCSMRRQGDYRIVERRVAPNTASTGLGLSATKSADTEPEVSPVAATGSQPSR